MNKTRILLVIMACVMHVSATFGQAADVVQPSSAPQNPAVISPQGVTISPQSLPPGALYDNGPFITGVGTGSAGADVSVLQNSSLGLTIYGFNAKLEGAEYYRIAEDFTVAGGSWDISHIDFYAYQTNSTITSTFTGVNLRIWDGPPNAPGSNIVWGDATTNRLTDSEWTGIYRVLEFSLSSTTRPVMRITAETPGLVLNTGTYWLDWQLAGSLELGPFVPPLTILGQTTTGNAIQLDESGWIDLVDLDFKQGAPFTIYGNAISPVPLGQMSLYLGILLMVVFVVIRAYRRI